MTTSIASSRLLSRSMRTAAAVTAACLLAACAGSPGAAPPGGGLSPAGAHRSLRGASRDSGSETLFVGDNYGEVDAYDVTTNAPPAAPLFRVKAKGTIYQGSSMAMSGGDLSVASYDNKGHYYDEVWSPAPTSKKSKAKYPCKGPPKLNFLYFPPIAASAAALFGLDTYEELGGISQFYYPFPSGKCPKLASSTFYDAAVAAGGYGIATIFASQSGNLYVAYYTSNGTGAIDEFPVGSTTPTTLGLLPSEFDFVAGGGIGNLAVDSLGHLIVTNASPDCNVRVFARDFRSSYLSLLSTTLIGGCTGGGFGVAGIALDATEGRIFIGDYYNELVEVMTYDASTGTGSYAYDFSEPYRPASLAVEPVDTF